MRLLNPGLCLALASSWSSSPLVATVVFYGREKGENINGKERKELGLKSNLGEIFNI